MNAEDTRMTHGMQPGPQADQPVAAENSASVDLSTGLFETITRSGHEEIIFCNNTDVGLKAIIAIHDTTLGPALGGLRMWPYETEQEAINDVLRLSRGMTYKAAVSGLNLGGGKAVIIGDPQKDKSEALFRALGKFCLLYTSPSPRDVEESRMPSSA